MGRPHRRGSETGIHHVMNRGVDRQPIFFADADRIEMGRRLADVHERFGVATLAYCLMTNHLHVVLRAPDAVLPQAMHHLTSVYSHHFNACHDRDGPLFRGRYHSIPVESDEYLLWVTRYIHRNPLDIAGVRSPRDYRWSSYRAYLELRPCPPFLDRQPVLDIVAGRIHELASLTEDDRPARPGTPEDLVRLVRCAHAVADLTGGASAGPVAKTSRTLLLLLARRTDDARLSRLIHEALGPCAEAGRACRRAEARLLADPGMAQTLSWIERQLAPRVTR